jgi:uncharacterized protein YlzI (FlbEa/FlbD family)
MIKLSRLDRQEIAINCDLIVWVEARPDTTLRMVMGESILVLDGVDEVVRRIAAFRSGVLRGAGLEASATSGARPALPAGPIAPGSWELEHIAPATPTAVPEALP